MKLIEDLINELANKNIPITDILFKAKILASRLHNQEFKSWIDNELNGYGDTTLPDYRVLSCQIVGTVADGFRRHSNFLIPLVGDEKLKKLVQTLNLHQSISTLDEFVRKGDGVKMSSHFSHDIIHGYLSTAINAGWEIEEARKEIDKVQIIQVLTSVRSKLLDFLLMLSNEVGEQEGINTFSEGAEKEKIASLFASAVFGDNATIIVGDHNTQIVKIGQIEKGNITSLEKVLRENDIEEADIAELREVIDTDNPDSDKKAYGSKVKLWIGKMLVKANDTTWKIGVGAAGKLLADAIHAYYGWK